LICGSASPEAGAQSRADQVSVEKASRPALDGVAGGETIARKKRFDRTVSRESAGMLVAADRLIKSQGSGGD